MIDTNCTQLTFTSCMPWNPSCLTEGPGEGGEVKCCCLHLKKFFVFNFNDNSAFLAMASEKLKGGVYK